MLNDGSADVHGLGQGILQIPEVPGDVLVLGSPFQHPATQRLMLGLGRHLDVGLEFLPSKQRFVFVGYPSMAVTLKVAGTPYTATRTVLPDDRVRYTDVGVLVTGPLDRIVGAGRHPFGEDAKRLVLAAGTRRLGTGIACAFVESPAMLAELEVDGELPEAGGVAFRVTAEGGGTTRITHVKLLQRLSFTES